MKYPVNAAADLAKEITVLISYYSPRHLLQVFICIKKFHRQYILSVELKFLF